MRSLTDWFEIIWFRWKVVAIITAAVVALMAVYLIVAPRIYETTASLYFDKAAPDPLKDPGAPQQDNSRLATEAQVIRSSKVVQQVVKKLNPIERKTYEDQWTATAKNSMPFDEWMQRTLLAGVVVEPQDDSTVMKVTAVASDPGKAAWLANSFASSYVEAQRELNTGPAQAYAKYLSGKMESARKDVETAESTLSSFVKATGISNNGDLNADAGQYATVAAQAAGASATASSAARRMSGAMERGIADAERTETVQRLSTEAATKSALVSDLEASYGPNHPKLLAAKAELDTIKARLASERKAAALTYARSQQAIDAAESAAAAAQASQLQSAAASQRSQLVAMSSNLGKFTTLQQDLASAQARYNELSARAAQWRLRGNVPLANVSQLDKAEAPDHPKSPKAGLLGLLAILLGLGLGAGVAILLEYLNPRVRTLANVEKLIGVPVVARLSLPREAPRMLTDARAG